MQHELLRRVVPLLAALVEIAATRFYPHPFVQIRVAAAHPPPIRCLIIPGKFQAPFIGMIGVSENQCVVRQRVRRQAADLLVIVVKAGHRQAQPVYGPDPVAQFVSNDFLGVEIRAPGQARKVR